MIFFIGGTKMVNTENPISSTEGIDCFEPEHIYE